MKITKQLSLEYNILIIRAQQFVINHECAGWGAAKIWKFTAKFQGCSVGSLQNNHTRRSTIELGERFGVAPPLPHPIMRKILGTEQETKFLHKALLEKKSKFLKKYSPF